MCPSLLAQSHRRRNPRAPVVSRMLDARPAWHHALLIFDNENAGSPKNEKNVRRLEANVLTKLLSFIGPSLAPFILQ